VKHSEKKEKRKKEKSRSKDMAQRFSGRNLPSLWETLGVIPRTTKTDKQTHKKHGI
jgi:hypothetical protein